MSRSQFSDRERRRRSRLAQISHAANGLCRHIPHHDNQDVRSHQQQRTPNPSPMKLAVLNCRKPWGDDAQVVEPEQCQTTRVLEEMQWSLSMPTARMPTHANTMTLLW